MFSSRPTATPPPSAPPSAPASTPSSPKIVRHCATWQAIGSDRLRSTTEPNALKTDYLVIGAGLHSLSFVDELLAQDEKATIVIVDKQPAPGGHWNDAYPFVSLHQPAAPYGVNSEPLSRNVQANGFEPMQVSDLASKERLLAYFNKTVLKFEGTGRVRYYPLATYRWEDRSVEDSAGQRYTVDYRKIVTPTSSVMVPAMRPPPFPVALGVDIQPVNALSSESEASFNRPVYVVVGGGKTATDAVLFLRSKGVPVEAITWIVPQEMWYLLRDSFDGAETMLTAFEGFYSGGLAESDTQSVFLRLERAGLVGRIDGSGPAPTVFRAATVLRAELDELRTLHDAGRIVRLGRVTAADADGLTLERGRIEMPLADSSDGAQPLLIDCSAQALAGYDGGAVANPFQGQRIHLAATGFFNVSMSGAQLAWIEANVQATEQVDADTRKNESWYGYLPGYIIWDTTTMLHALYLEYKMLMSFTEIGGFDWVGQCRTSYTSSRHVPLPLLLWRMFGPSQLMAKMQAFGAKMEAGGFNDAPFPPAWREKLEAEEMRKLKRRRALFAPLARCLPIVQRCMPEQPEQAHAKKNIACERGGADGGHVS